MTTNERAATTWSKMTKGQRMAWLRSGAALTTTSSERTTAVAKLVKKAAGK